jgi:hydroxymethylpyrimidine pyrophosphatase-like HAD family hydrolase
MKPYKNQDPIRLVVADVDGTLVTQEKVLTAKTKEAVSQLRAAGIAFAITSGRPPRGMQTVIKDVNLSTVVAGFNGGVYTTAKLDPIVMRDLPRDAAARSIELIEEHDLVAWLYTDTFVTGQRGSRLIVDHTRIEPMKSLPAMAASTAAESQPPVTAVVSSK